MNFEKIKNKKQLILLILTLIMFLGISFGAVFFIYDASQSKANVLETGLISIEFTEGETINLASIVPVIDEIGLEFDPYEFSVTNTSSIPIKMNIQFINDASSTLPIEAVRYGLVVDDELVQKGSLSKLDEEGNFVSYENFEPGKTINCKLMLWVDYYYTSSRETFSGKIKVIGESSDAFNDPTYISLSTKDYPNNIITLSSGASKTLNLSLFNNAKQDVLYKIYYTVNNGSGEIIGTNTTANLSGTMNTSKDMELTIVNPTDETLTIQLGVKGALGGTITLDENQKEITFDTEGPTITNVSDAGEGKITFSVSDSGSGVSKYCVNQSASDTTSCIWLDAISGTQTTGVIATENGDYHVHVKDLAGNIGHSSIVNVVIDTTPPTVTVSAVDNNTTSPKIKIISNEDGEYCVNTSSTITNMSNCTFSGNITANTAITTGVFTTATTYYVHVKDSASNIGISSKVAISRNYIASTFVSKNYGTGGLVAVKSGGTLYSGSGTIREYRYSGASVNNYITFNNGEMWRIVGVFKNSSGKWNFKLMRNTILTSAELPSTYTYNGTSHTIEYSTSGTAYWNYTKTGTNYNDWTTAGLQYYLNGTDGYYGTLSSGAKVLVDTNYTYYLGNYNYNTATAINCYTNERNASYKHSGNFATWSKSTNPNANGIALLYPSDYYYSASSSYWSNQNFYADEGMNTTWMFTTANHTIHTSGEWLLSPSYISSDPAAYWTSTGSTNYISTRAYAAARPVLNLLASAPIDTNHQGTEADPYVILE